MSMNLANKYRPKAFSEMVEQKLVVQMVKTLCDDENLNCRNFLFIGPAGTGKAQPLDSKVLTPSGFIEMRDVSIGTEVFTAEGNIGRVSGIYPQGVRPIYEIELQDRTKIRVSDEHLNVFYRYNENTKQREDYCMTTKELIDFFETSSYKLRIDTPVIDWPEADVPIDPYLLGALIGDGSLSDNFQFSNNEPDVIAKVDSILRRDWGKMLRKCKGDNVDYDIVDINYAKYKYIYTYQSTEYYSSDTMRKTLVEAGYPAFDDVTLRNIAEQKAVRVFKNYPELQRKLTYVTDPNYKSYLDGDPLRTELRGLGLLCKSTCKHIPSEYLFNSKANRLALLQGLYDTDGYTDKNGGGTTFTTCSDQLSVDFAFLVRSLGIRDTVVHYPAKYKLKGSDKWIYTGTTGHDHNLKIPNDLPFYSSKKHGDRYHPHQNPPLRNIVSITYVGEEECQCIMIDHPDHTYISDGFIPTHNTTLCRIISNVLNEGNGEPIEIDAASYSGVDKMREIVAQAKTYPVGMKYKIFIIDEAHALSAASWAAGLKVLEESPAKTIFMFATTNPEKIPATILSRVQTFQLSKISLEGITTRLKYVLECEKAEGRDIIYEDSAVTYIAKLAQGGMRDALTLLDKALAYSNNITSQGLVEALNLPQYDDYFALLAAYAKRDNEEITRLIDKVYNSGVNFVKWFEGFHAFVMNVVKFIFIQDIESTMIPSHYKDKLAGYGPKHSVICLKLANKLLKLNADLKTTPYLQETALTYLCSIPKKEA